LPICDYGWESGPWIVLHIHKNSSNWYPKMKCFSKEVWEGR
jgi:hypothetical protein